MVKYWKALNISIQNYLEYKFNFLTSFLFTLIPFSVNILIWLAVASYSGESLALTNDEIITYYFINLIITNLIVCNVQERISEDIRCGEINKYLIKPMNYIFYQFMVDLPQRIVFLVMGCVPAALIGFALRRHIYIKVSVLHILLFIVALIIGYLMNFFVNLIISEYCFYITRVSALFSSFNVLKSIVSGDVFPLNLLPQGVYQVFTILPFKYLNYFPIMIILQQYSLGEIIKNIGFGVMWLIFLYACSRYLWIKGLKRYEAFGG